MEEAEKGPGGRDGGSVLDRIRRLGASLDEGAPRVEYRPPAEVRRSFREAASRAPGGKGADREPPPRGRGRPKVAPGARARDVRVTLTAGLFREVERRRRGGTRSGALCGLLEKGLRYEGLRLRQAGALKGLVGEFAKTFATVRVRRGRGSWRTSRIDLGENELALARLYRTSLEIRRLLDSMGVGTAEALAEMRGFLTEREARHLEFASVPERIGSVVRPPGADGEAP